MHLLPRRNWTGSSPLPQTLGSTAIRITESILLLPAGFRLHYKRMPRIDFHGYCGVSPGSSGLLPEHRSVCSSSAQHLPHQWQYLFPLQSRFLYLLSSEPEHHWSHLRPLPPFLFSSVNGSLPLFLPAAHLQWLHPLLPALRLLLRYAHYLRSA